MIPSTGAFEVVTGEPFHYPILDAQAAAAALAGREKGVATLGISLDLGLTTETVRINERGLALSEVLTIGWPTIEEIAGGGERCFAMLENGSAWPIGVYSETTGWYRSLIRTGGTPTTLVGGFTMHRIKDSDPLADTREKIKAIRPVAGRVLDTATGLGYTAIEAASTAAQVLTVELDPAAVEIIRYNPWSRDLFTSENIVTVLGDIYELAPQLDDGSFDRIIHDPPTLSLAGELYSTQFYRELYRLLNRRGRLFHYIGDPTSRGGRRTTDGVIRRLQDAGFERVRRAPAAFGVVAYR